MKFKHNKSESYLVKADLSQKDYWELEGGTRLLAQHQYNPDHRHQHANRGVIVSTSPKNQFKVGQEVIVWHTTFENTDRTSNELFKQNGEYYFYIEQSDILFAVDEKEEYGLVPREGILLCLGVEGKLLDTTLELTGDLVGRRRDVVKIAKLWEGCTDFEVGEYLWVKNGGDYEVEFNGQLFIATDIYNEDTYAVSDTGDVHDSELRKQRKVKSYVG